MATTIKRLLAGISTLFIFTVLSRNGISDSLGVTISYAQEPNILAPVYTVIELVMALLVHILQFIFHVVNAMIPIVWDQRLLFAIDSGGVLLKLWQFSRDIVNVIFAVMLVAGAIMTVVQANSSFIQQYYKKFFIAIILVNFSWFFPRVILDVAHVLTASIYQVPSIILQDEDLDCKINYWDTSGPGKPVATDRECKIIIKYIFTNRHPVATGSLKNSDETGWHNPVPMVYYCDAIIDQNFKVPDASGCEIEGDSGGFSFGDRSSNIGYTMMNGIVMNYGRLADMTAIKNFRDKTDVSSPTNTIKSVILIIIQLFFVFFLLLMMTLSIIAIMIALAIRLVMIWLCVSFMPFYFLGFVTGPIFGFDTQDVLTKYFLPAAFLPAIIAAPIAIGFTMLLLGHKSFGCGVDSSIPNDMGYMCENLDILFGSPPLIEMFWMFLSIFVLWKGVFMAMKSNDIVNDATAGVKNWGDSMMKGSVKAVTNVPLPVPGLDLNGDGTKGNDRISAAGLIGAGKNLPKATSNLFKDKTPAVDKNNVTGATNAIDRGSRNQNSKVSVSIKNIFNGNSSASNKESLQKLLSETGAKNKAEIITALKNLPSDVEARLGVDIKQVIKKIDALNI